jgi:hypothetical protein
MIDDYAPFKIVLRRLRGASPIPVPSVHRQRPAEENDACPPQAKRAPTQSQRSGRTPSAPSQSHKSDIPM